MSKHSGTHHQSMNYKPRAASSSLNRKDDERLMFRPPAHATANAPTPKNYTESGNRHSHADETNTDSNSKTKNEFESGSKIRRANLHKVKKVNKIPLGKKDMNPTSQANRSTSRGKQLSAKNRLVYKKDSLKSLNTNGNYLAAVFRSISTRQSMCPCLYQVLSYSFNSSRRDSHIQCH